MRYVITLALSFIILDPSDARVKDLISYSFFTGVNFASYPFC